MSFPSVKEFTKNPIPTIALLAIIGMGYLAMEVRNSMQGQINSLKIEVQQLKEENKELRAQYVELAKSIK